MGRPLNATTEKVLALRRDRLPPAQIAAMTGLPYKRVINICAYARQTGKPVPKGRVEGSVPAFRNVPDSIGDPEGPFTYAAPRPSSLIDEIAARAAARPARREFRLLLRADGAWLDEAGLGFVFDRDRAGRFTAAEIARMRARNPARRDLREERA